MLKRKFRSIAALTSAVLFVNAGICTFTASADSSAVFTSNEEYSLYIDHLPTKTVYQIGEELDITGTKIYGSYTDGELVGDIFPTDLARYLENGMMSLDTSEFDNTKAGTYTIYIHYGTAKASFEVTVEGEEKQEYYSIYIDQLPTKTMYMIGEELDITGTKIYGSYTDGELVGDIFPTDLARYLENGMMSLDTSEFDNTKAGTYTISVHYGTAKASFEVTVLGDAAKLPNGDANGDGNFTIADMVIVQKHIMGKKTAILSDWKCADLYEDGKIDVYDFIVMRENFVKNMK